MDRINQDDIYINCKEDTKEVESSSSCTKFQVPLIGLLIQLALGICCLLEWGLWDTPEDWRDDKYLNIKRNAFGASWFNVGGVLLHYLPNALFAFFTGWLIEWNVGSLNMVFVWFWGYFFAVGYTIARYGGDLTGQGGWGFSFQLYQWFTVAGGVMFFRFWWFPVVKSMSAGNAILKGKNLRLKIVYCLWYIFGISLLLGGGWIGNYGILGLINIAAYIVEGFDPNNVDHHTHDMMTCYGYVTVVLLWVLLWWQTEGLRVEQDVSTPLLGSGWCSIVWIKSMKHGEHSTRIHIGEHSKDGKAKKRSVNYYTIRRSIISVVLCAIVLGLGCSLLPKAVHKH